MGTSKKVKKNDLSTVKGRAAQKAMAKKVGKPKLSVITDGVKGTNNTLPRFTFIEVLQLVEHQIITSRYARHLLSIEEEIADTRFSEKHAVAIKAIGDKGSIGLLHLYGNGSALFVPTDRSPVKNFETCGLTFTIEPVSIKIEDPAIKPATSEEATDEEVAQEPEQNTTSTE